MDIDKKSVELELVKESLEGSQNAFEQLFNLHKDALKTMLIHLSGNEFDANDLLQETFIKAYLNLAKYNSAYAFSGWLGVIGRNTFIDHYRRKGIVDDMVIVDSVLAYDLAGDNPEELIIIDERRKEFEVNISKLNDNYKKIIEMRYYLGLSYEEIAEELGIPVGTVKTRLFRAKERLNDIITKK